MFLDYQQLRKGWFITLFLLLCLLLFVRFFSEGQNFGGKSKLDVALISHTYRDSLLLTLAVHIPALFDLFLDIIFMSKGGMSSSKGHLPRIISLICPIICCSCLIHLNNKNLSITTLYWALIHLQMLGIAASALSYIQTLSKGFWSVEKTIIILFTIGISFICAVNCSKVSSIKLPFGALSIIFVVLSYLYYTFQTCRWYLTSLDILSFQTIPPHLVCSLFYMIILHMGYLGLFFMFIICSEEVVNDLGVSFITVLQYYLLIVTMLMSSVHNRGMRLSNDSVKDAMDIKRQVIRYFSHEIRNPINTISIGLDILHKQIHNKATDTQELFTEMLASSKTTERMLDDLLTYEKLHEKEHKLVFHAVHIYSFTRNCTQASIIQGGYKEISVQFNQDVEDRDVFVKADPFKLQQVISTLINNAVRVTPRGGTVSVHGYVKVADTEFIKKFRDQTISRKSLTHIFRIDVTDMGSETAQDFNALSSFDIGVLQSGQGAGLGLWICNRIINMHQGKIGIHRNVNGIGSTIYIELPLATESSPLLKYFTAVNTHGQNLFSSVVSAVVATRTKNARVGSHSPNMRQSGVTSYIPPPAPRRPHQPSNGHGFLLSSVSARGKKITILNSKQENSSEVPTPPTQNQEPVRVNDHSKNGNDTPQEGVGTDASNEEKHNLTKHESSKLIKPAAKYWSRLEIQIDEQDGDNDQIAECSPSPNIPTLPQFLRNKSKKNGELGPAYSVTNSSNSSSLESDSTAVPKKSNGQFTALSPILSDVSESHHNEEEDYQPKKSCLIVDDVLSNRKMLLRVLKDDFDSFDQAEDGIQALNKMKISMDQNHPYQVILMDFVMPNMDGPTATKEIRAMGFKGAIFGVTGNAQQKDIDHFVECGADRVFTKPLDVTDLRRTLSCIENTVFAF